MNHSPGDKSVEGIVPLPGANAKLIGRASEVVQLGRMVHSGAVLIVGPSGVGKTFLAETLAGEFASWDRYHIRGAATLTSVSLPLDDTGASVQLEPDPWRHLIASVRASRALRPQLLLIDDAHLLDEQAARTIAHLIAVIRCHAILTQRAGTSPAESIVGLWKDQLVERFELKPLSDESIRELTRQLLGTTPSPRLEHWILSSARGIPLFVREFIAGGIDDGSIVVSGENADFTRIPTASQRLRELIATQLARLSSAETAVLIALATAQPLDESTLARAAPPAIVRSLCASGLVSETATGYMLGHPLFGELTLAFADAALIRAIRTDLSAAMQSRDPSRAAALLLANNERPSPALLDRALQFALSTQRVDLAVALASALADVRQTAQDLARAAELEAMSGNWHLATQRFQDAARLAATDADIAMVACAQSRAHFEFQHDVGVAQSIAADAARRLTGPNSAAVRVFEMRARIFVEPLGPLYPELRHAASDEKLPWGAQAIAAVDAVTLAWTIGRPFEAIRIAEAARGLRSMTAYDSIRMAQATVGAETWARGTAAAMIAQLHLEDLAAQSANPDGEVLVPVGRMLVAARRGRAEDVIRSIVEADWSARAAPNRLFAPISYAECAFAVASMRNPPVAVGDLLAEMEAPVADGRVQSESLRHLARARIAFRAGRHVETRQWLTDAVDVAKRQTAGIYESLARRERVMLLGGELDDVDRLAELAELAGGGLFALIAHEARAVAADDSEALDQVALQAALFGADAIAWEASARSHALHLRAAAPQAALVSELRLRKIGPSFGAQWNAAPWSPPILTEREWEVVELVAGSMTNAEVGASLFISPHTVKRHLERIGMRTGLHGRAQFAALTSTAQTDAFHS